MQVPLEWKRTRPVALFLCSQKFQDVFRTIGNEIGMISFQLRARTEPPAYTYSCYPGIYSGLHVDTRISQIDYCFFVNSCFSIISKTTLGSGLAGTPSRCPNICTNFISGKYCLISL